jgi:hypothetical protein
MAAGCGGLVVVLLLLVAGYLGWANAMPGPVPDHRTLPSPNGYDAVLAAVTRISLQSVPSSGSPWRAAPSELRRELPRVRPALSELRAGLRLPYLAPPRDPNTPIPSAAYRNAARHLVAEAALAMADQHPGEAVERSLDAIELGVSLRRGSGLGGTMCGAAVAAIGQRGAERSVDQLSAAEATVAGWRLDDILTELPSPGDVMAEDRRETLFWLREIFAGRAPLPDSPAALGTLGTPTPADVWKDRARLLVYPKSWDYRRLDRYLRAVETEIRKPYPARKPLAPAKTVMGDLWPPFAEGSYLFTRNETALRLLRGRLALQEYRMRHGAYPDRLEALVPRVLRTLPLDPFSEQPLRYRRTGSTYLLYSVGPDLVDGGGQPIHPWSSTYLSRGDFVAGKLFPRPTAPPPSPPPHR